MKNLTVLSTTFALTLVGTFLEMKRGGRVLRARKHQRAHAFPVALLLIACSATTNAAATVAGTPVRFGPGTPSPNDYYPDASRRLGEQGAATVRACVDTTGQLSRTPQIVTSSGNARLDGAALAFTRGASGHFIPATVDGRAAADCFQFSVRFVLSGGNWPQQAQVAAPTASQLATQAAAGNLAAEVALADRYKSGTGVPQDYKRAAFWYRKAASRGAAYGELSLGDLYENGTGVPENERLAVVWYKRAASHGTADAAVAADHLGLIYEDGDGVPRSYAKALQWYSRAASLGSEDAEKRLGNLYWFGNGVTQSYERAVSLYLKAGDPRDFVVDLHLAEAYTHGYGVATDYAKALGWCEKAKALAADSIDLGQVQDLESQIPDVSSALAQLNSYLTGQRIDYDAQSDFLTITVASTGRSQEAKLSELDLSRISAGINPANYYQVNIPCKGGGNCANGNSYNWLIFNSAPQYAQGVHDSLTQLLMAAAGSKTGIGFVATDWSPGSDTSSSQSSASGDSDGQNTSDSVSEWQQEHQNKISDLKQQIAAHEEQAQQDDAYAEQAEAQVQEDENSNASGPGAGWLALGHAVQGAASAGLAQKMRNDAENERREAQDEREQLAELGAEQPPVAENNSESIALTRTQTQMIQTGNTIQGALNQQEDNLGAVQRAAREESERRREEENSGGGQMTQEPAAAVGTSSSEGASQASGTKFADASGNESQGGSACQGFPAFIMANASTTGAAETVGQYQYLHEQIQYDIPGGYAISGGQVGVYQGADLAAALQNIQQGYQGHDLTVESGEGGTTTATAVSSDTATLDVTQGNILVGTAVAISNGSFEQSYHGYTQGAVPSPLALTLTATPSSCQRVPTQTGAGTLQ